MSWSDRPLAEEGAPKWFQIASILRSAIVAGDFPPGSVLPSEAQLNSAFGISRTTARAALNRLVQDGLVMRRSGVGSVVLPSRVDQPVSQIRSFTDDMKSRGLEPSFEMIKAGWSTANAEVTQALGLASGDTPFHSVRLLKANGRVIGHSESWIRPDILDADAPPTEHDLANGSLYDWLGANRQQEITGGTEFIEAQAASKTIAQHLNISAGSPVLTITRTATTPANLPIEYAIVTFRSDRYRFRVDL
tara:strand:+ start:54009 stop:54752 length:744 start_codon:yes stop_codon:yes gene_type:complete